MMKNMLMMKEAAFWKKRSNMHIPTRAHHTQAKACAELMLHIKLMRGKGVAAIHTKGKGKTSSGPEAAADAKAQVPIMVVTFGAAAKNDVLHGITLMTVGAAAKHSVTLVALVRARPVDIMTIGAATENSVTLVALVRARPVDLREKMFGDSRNDTSPTPIGPIRPRASLAADTILLDVSLLDVGLRSRPHIDVVFLLPLPAAASQGGERDNQAVPDQTNADIGGMTALSAARCGCPTNEAAS